MSWLWAPMLLAFLAMKAGHVMSSTVLVEEGSKFCNRTGHLLNCVFTKTSQQVVLEDVEIGIQRVKLEAATAFRGRSCKINLGIWSSKNVTLMGSNVEEAVDEDSFRRPTPIDRSGRIRNGNKETVNEYKPIRFPGDDQPPGKDLPGGSNHPPRRNECFGNASIYQSDIERLHGDFDHVSLQSNTVRSINGTFRNLMAKLSTILEFSAAGENVIIEETEVEDVNQLKVLNRLRLHEVTLRRLSEPGITLFQPTGYPSKEDSPTHEMSIVKIGSMKTGKLVVNSSHLSMNGITINETGTGAISVEAGGMITMNNVSIKQGPDACLVLRRDARIILNNFTLRGKTIRHLDISIKNSQWPVYPLLAHASPSKPSVRIRAVQPGDAGLEFLSLDWYWLPVMLAVGLISGMVIGCAARCGEGTKGPNDLSSPLTFSDLIAHDRREEEDGCTSNGCLGPQRPEFVRQDSGLTSSSFASYTACPDRRRSSVRHSEDLDHVLIDTADPNIFIHVSPLSCTREDIIYEEVEAMTAMPQPTGDNHYLNMNEHIFKMK